MLARMAFNVPVWLRALLTLYCAGVTVFGALMLVMPRWWRRQDRRKAGSEYVQRQRRKVLDGIDDLVARSPYAAAFGAVMPQRHEGRRRRHALGRRLRGVPRR